MVFNFSYLVAFIALVISSNNAFAIQDLTSFLDAGRRTATANRIVRSSLQEREADQSTALLSLFPTLSLTAAYSRNQYPTILLIPSSTDVASGMDMGSTTSASLIPSNFFSAAITVNAPLFDFVAITRLRAARLTARAAREDVGAIEIQTDIAIAQAYFRLIAAANTMATLNELMGSLEDTLQVVQERVNSGLARPTDLDRVLIEIERVRQTDAQIRPQFSDARRQLELLTGMDPDVELGQFVQIETDSTSVGAFEQYLDGVSDLPAVRAAQLRARASSRMADAAVRTFVPTLTATATQNFTNNPGVTQHPNFWVAGISAQWRLDSANAGRARSSRAAARTAELQEEQLVNQAVSTIQTAYQQVVSQTTRLDSTRQVETIAERAENQTSDYYNVGTATVDEVLQSEREMFNAGISKLQAECDLGYARALLNVVSGHR